MIQDAAFQELRTKHNLSESESEELSKYLQQMRDLPSSVSDRMKRREHQRLHRLLSFMTRGSEALQQDVLRYLWQLSEADKKRRIEERKKARDRRADSQDVITI